MSTTPGFVGYSIAEVADPTLGLTFPLLLLYPTSTSGRVEQLGPYELDIAHEAPVAAGIFPLVLISHGTGGSPLVYRTLAHYLARHGFIVGLPEHPFNNRNDNTWAGTIQNLEARPRHLQLAIDSISTHPRFSNSVQPDAVAVIGHSMGGYTALALAGGLPTAFPYESPTGQEVVVPTPFEGRVKALVLLAPATPWFRKPAALRNVKAPILLLEAELDAYTPAEHGQLVVHGVATPQNVVHRTVPNAGHFSFLSPFPPALATPSFLPSQDPPGFDRTVFQAALQAEVVNFLLQYF
jgi:predicted dienelactone hydrolase